MAIPWLVVLKTVPWTQVINNAPKVAEGAKKLWNTVSGQSSSTGQTSADTSPSSGADSIADLPTRLAALESATDKLHDQMLASSELIKSLADQNAELVKRIEAGRVRFVWLARATVVIGIVGVIGLVLALLAR